MSASRDGAPIIVIAEFMDETAVERLSAHAPTLYDPELADRRAELEAALGEARALIVRNRTRVDRALLERAPALLTLGRLGVGLDNVDLDACKERGVRVRPATGANDDAVAEYVIAAALTLRRRRAFRLGAAMLEGAWPRQLAIGDELAGARLGLIGLGAIARKTAARARALGMTIAAYDPHLDPNDPAWTGVARAESLDALLPSADVLSLHVPLTAETRDMVDAAALARMPSDGIVINAARGGVLDETALAAALRAGSLGGAALDVFEREPATAEALEPFRGLDNVLLTPHVAGVTAQSNKRVSEMIADLVLEDLR